MTDRRRQIADKVACPACGELQSRVEKIYQSLVHQQTGAYWRHRQCTACGTVFETEEIVRRIISTASSSGRPPETLAS